MITDVRLQPMTDDDYSFWRTRAEVEYADAKRKANGYSAAEAAEVSRADFHRLLPMGKASGNQFLYSAKNAQNARVAFVWFALRRIGDRSKAFVYDIVVESEFRGKGYGRATMLAAEAEARRKGAAAIGLHVFGYNETAIALYRSLDYATTDLVMEKEL